MKFMQAKSTAAIVASFFAMALLSGCGSSQGDRALSGAGLGAGAGAAGAALLGGPVLGGAAIGAAAGAAAGALTDDEDVDLGKPIWRD